jgi:hypothetical protein
MARTKRIEKAEPKQAEIISFASLKAARDAKRADIFLTVGMIDGDPEPHQVCLCRMKNGTYTLAYVESASGDGTWTVLSARVADMEEVCGRVVSVQLQEAI